MTFLQKVTSAVADADSLLCVGLDVDAKRLPEGVDAVTFACAIIDATHDLVCAYKPNSAFFEAQGAGGIAALQQICDHLHATCPQVPIILDAKRADIGSTNGGYVQFAYDYLGADAITVHPYLGREALAPFLDRADKGTIVLCRTSNPGAGEFQDMLVDGRPLYERVAQAVAQQWNAHGNCMLVVGATYPEELGRVRQLAGDDLWFLVPGVGAQGGDVAQVMAQGANGSGAGLLINSSRDILYAGAETGDVSDFAAAARARAIQIRDEINTHRHQ